jgi:ubiquinone/menaquinone biosynthesis C-methylase UbiE
MNPSFHDHFSSVANRYADFRPHYPGTLFEYLALVTQNNAVAWDCAAGSGQATLDLAARFDHVVATDASGDQIASAKSHPKIEYRVATAEQSGLPDASVSLITVAQALHWFDLERFFTEAKRVLKPEGVLAVWAYGINQVEGEAVNQLVQEYYSNTVGPYWPPERKLVEDGYRSIPFPFDELAAPAFRMEAHWTLEQLIGYFSTWSATTRYIKATGKNPLEQLTADLARAWGDTESPRPIVWPLSLRVGRKQAGPKTLPPK